MPAPAPTGGRRSDATRNVELILAAAVGVLSVRPDASMAEIAGAAGVSRQTVYSHFPSRESLLEAVAERALEQATAAIEDALGSAEGPGAQLTALIPAWWEKVADHAHVLEALGDQLDVKDSRSVRAFHDPILERLTDLAERGRRTGEFTAAPPDGWLASSFLGLVHTAAEEVAHGRMSRSEARAALEDSIPRVFGFES